MSDAVSCFTVELGRASIPSELAPWDILCTTLRKITNAYELETSELELNTPDTLHHILRATFDTDTQAFLTEDSSMVFDHLKPTQKDRILAQAIAAIAMVFQRLENTGRVVTLGLLNRETQFFAESEQRTRMLNAIEKSHLFEQCYMQSQIADMILGAMKAEDASISKSFGDDSLDVMISSATICERPENMGLPWGFTIMALN